MSSIKTVESVKFLFCDTG